MTQHNFENDNKYHERSVQARKSTLVSVVVNIFLSALQVVVGIFSGSQGLIADGMHSFSDLVADGVVLMANKKSRRPSDHDHHYGHWRYENGASLVQQPFGKPNKTSIHTTSTFLISLSTVFTIAPKLLIINIILSFINKLILIVDKY